MLEGMEYYFAPMEGVNGYVYRQTHRRFFPGIDRYFIPFLSPNQHHILGRREHRELSPENNQGVPAVPQLLTKRAEDFLWTARQLWDMGYEEVNLNLGCPSGTVTAKGKGAGFLAKPQELREFLDEVFERATGKVSVKTRLGMRDPEEFGPILELYNRYPIHELTIHPRIQQDFYRHPVRREVFAACWERSRNPVCYNGDLSTMEDCHTLEKEFPAIHAAMLGRALVADPSLVTRIKGGTGADRDTLRRFHDELYEGHALAFESRKNAMLRMKEIWFYHIHLFQHHDKLFKAIRKAKDCIAYEQAVEEVFQALPLSPELHPNWLG